MTQACVSAFSNQESGLGGQGHCCEEPHTHMDLFHNGFRARFASQGKRIGRANHPLTVKGRQSIIEGGARER